MRDYWLTSARLGFSYWTLEDLPLALGLWGDAAVTRYHAGPWSRDRIGERLTHELARRERSGVQYWPLFLRATREHVGCCGLQMTGPGNAVWELGCYLRRDFWSRGLGREAAEAVVDHAFSRLGAKAICAGHHPANESSRKFLQQLGFHHTHEEFYPATNMMEPRYRLKRHHIKSSGTVNCV